MKRILLTTVVAVGLFASTAFAATFTINANPGQEGQQNIASGFEVVASCDDNVEVDITYNTPIDADEADWTVDRVVIRANAPDCTGYTLEAALELADGSFVPMTGVVTLGAFPDIVSGAHHVGMEPASTVYVAEVVGVAVILDEPNIGGV